MHEFGQRPRDVVITEEDGQEDQGRPSIVQNDDLRPAYVRPPKPESPVPFAQYKGRDRVPEIRVTRPTFDEPEDKGGDEHAGGCCAKCVIM